MKQRQTASQIAECMIMEMEPAFRDGQTNNKTIRKRLAGPVQTELDGGAVGKKIYSRMNIYIKNAFHGETY